MSGRLTANVRRLDLTCRVSPVLMGGRALTSPLMDLAFRARAFAQVSYIKPLPTSQRFSVQAFPTVRRWRSARYFQDGHVAGGADGEVVIMRTRLQRNLDAVNLEAFHPFRDETEMVGGTDA
jgi:hypothetical protein